MTGASCITVAPAIDRAPLMPPLGTALLPPSLATARLLGCDVGRGATDTMSTGVLCEGDAASCSAGAGLSSGATGCCSCGPAAAGCCAGAADSCCRSREACMKVPSGVSVSLEARVMQDVDCSASAICAHLPLRGAGYRLQTISLMCIPIGNSSGPCSRLQLGRTVWCRKYSIQLRSSRSSHLRPHLSSTKILQSFRGIAIELKAGCALSDRSAKWGGAVAIPLTEQCQHVVTLSET